jgi:hypothetical protein
MTASLSLNSATFAWDDLAERLERFLATWEQASEPTIAEFLPAEPPAHRKLVLVELIKVDLEQRTTRGCPKRLDAYSTEFPELTAEGEPPCDLIYEEYHIRRVAGEAVSPCEYFERFPRSAEALRRLMGTDQYSVSTQLGASRRIAGLAAGQRLDDFELLLEVGQGAFGSVFLARQLSMHRLVALKVSADRGNEPQALATLEHPNIVRVYDQRVLAEQKVRLLYMQFAAGWTTTLHVMAGVRRAGPPAAPRQPHDPLTVRMTQVLRKALAPEPADRHTDGAALARELLLCLNPRAWDLVHDLGSGWRDFARRHPVAALFPVNMPPFLLAGAFNLWFNTTYYVPLYLSPREQHAFWLVTAPLNAILYSLGIGLVVWFAMPVARGLRRVTRGEEIVTEELLAARRRALVLGHGVAAVGLSLWIIAGMAFPLSIHALVGSFPASGYLHFMLSMVACGIISCCLPFLAMTWLSVRVFFPALLASGTPDAAEQRQLTALGRYAGYYLFSSPVAPLLALLLVLFAGPDTRAAMVVLVLVAIAGFAAAYATWQRILTDLAALSVATRPTDMIGLTTDTVDTI